MNMSPPRLAALVIGAAVLIRLILAAGTGLGIDESYMVAAAHSFELSYFDHPPASWWLELLARHLAGNTAPLTVRAPFLILSALSSWLLYGLTARLYSARAGLWAVVAFSLSPVFSVAFGSWVLPDGPLDFFLLAAAYALARALGIARPALAAQPEPAWWLAAGLLAGLAMTAKYNAALTLAGALGFLIADREARVMLARPYPWVAALLALAVFSPVLLWNALNDFVSFHYQGGRAAGVGFHPLKPFIVWIGEAIFVLPWIWLPMVLLLARALRGTDRRDRFLGWLAVIPVMLFSVIALWSSRKILFHWAAPGYLLLFPLLGAWIAGLGPTSLVWVKRSAAGSAALLVVAVLFIAGQISFGIVPHFNALFAAGKSPELQAVDWTDFRRSLQKRGYLNQGNLVVAGLRWFDAGKIGYALEGKLPVTVFGGNAHEFGIISPPVAFIGDNVLIAATPGDPAQIMQQYAPYFASITALKPIDIRHHGSTLVIIPMLLGHDLLRVPAEPATP
jgi:hypothetical protein